MTKGRFGMSYWGFQGDYRPGSFPDGGATSMWPILRSFQEQGWETYLMYEDRDAIMYKAMGSSLFTGPCAKKRHDTYLKVKKTDEKSLMNIERFPDLNILLMEWRWVIQGVDQPYLARQAEIIDHYSNTNTKIFIWDTDHKLTAADEQKFPSNVTVVEPSFRPRLFHKPRISLHYAVDTSLLAAGQRLVTTAGRELTYVGNRYERDVDVQRWLHPVSERLAVKIVGKWEPASDMKILWPHIRFEPRVDAAEFPRLISGAVAVPLLAKTSYHETGLMALRIFETVSNGSIPISLACFTGGHLITQRVARDANDLFHHVHALLNQSEAERLVEHMQAVEMLEQFSYQKFYERLTSL